MSVKEILCMTSTMKFARSCGLFPKKGREFDPGVSYYCRVALTSSTGLVVMIGSFLHLIKGSTASVYVSLDADIIYTLSLAATFFFTATFLYKSKTITELYLFFSDFEEFGKPNHFDEYNDFFNKFSKVYYTLLRILVSCIVGLSVYYNFKNCEKLNLKHGLNEVCGLFSYTWMPFDINYFPAKQIFLVIQLLGAYTVYMVAGLHSFIIFETIQHLRVRLKHVNYLFCEAVTEQDPKKCREKFNFAVRYHTFLFSLEEKLNGAFGTCMLAHLAITAPILGTGAFSVLSAGSWSAFLVSMGWFNGLTLNCLSGQWLQDECIAIGIDLYNADWLHCTDDIKQGIMFVIQRTWTPMNLRAGAFAIMDYRMFLAVLKASYSYITLLTQT